MTLNGVTTRAISAVGELLVFKTFAGTILCSFAYSHLLCLDAAFRFCARQFSLTTTTQCSNGTGTHPNAVPVFLDDQRRSGPSKTTRLIVKLHQAYFLAFI